MVNGFPKGAPELEMPAEFYDRYYSKKQLIKMWRFDPQRTVVWYPALVLAKPPVLDVGCGGGMFATMCRDFGIAYAGGFDFSNVAIERARERCPEFTFECCEADKSEMFTSADYETAVVLEVLEHVYNDRAILRAIPVGKQVVLSVPSFHSPGHARWFSELPQIRKRYEGIVEFDTMIVEGSNNDTNKWFIGRGTRV